jgi:hypothetical protein
MQEGNLGLTRFGKTHLLGQILLLTLNMVAFIRTVWFENPLAIVFEIFPTDL